MVGHFQEFEDEYLETMYEFHEHEPLGLVRTGDLATRLGVSPASATEMVQRLASRGLLEYIPYKGARLTEDGLIHGRKMKRRHRLAEVLLDLLPFEGDAHETACRLEHAIDDDMEVALSRLIGPTTTDPSGRPIPSPTPDIAVRLDAAPALVPLSLVSSGQAGTVSMLLLSSPVVDTFAEHGFAVGSRVLRQDDHLVLDDNTVLHLSPEWMPCIFLTLDKKTA
jgi:Mn-dependent DtxR family transcriptional regulator